MFYTRSFLAVAAVTLFGAASVPSAVFAQTITDDLICNGCVNATDIATQAVTSRALRPNAVTTSKISNGAVSSDKLDSTLQARISALEATVQELQTQIDALQPPPSRFIDNADGTVTDTSSGLIWLKDASCDSLLPNPGNGGATWADALTAVAALAAGQCGLADGSSAGDWRIPSIAEWQSLAEVATRRGYNRPALTNTQGTDIWSEGDPFAAPMIDTWYWSTTPAESGPNIKIIFLEEGQIQATNPANDGRAWPVRGSLLSRS